MPPSVSWENYAWLEPLRTSQKVRRDIPRCSLWRCLEYKTKPRNNRRVCPCKTNLNLRWPIHAPVTVMFVPRVQTALPPEFKCQILSQSDEPLGAAGVQSEQCKWPRTLTLLGRQLRFVPGDKSREQTSRQTGKKVPTLPGGRRAPPVASEPVEFFLDDKGGHACRPGVIEDAG